MQMPRNACPNPLRSHKVITKMNQHTLLFVQHKSFLWANKDWLIACGKVPIIHFLLYPSMQTNNSKELGKNIS